MQTADLGSPEQSLISPRPEAQQSAACANSIDCIKLCQLGLASTKVLCLQRGLPNLLAYSLLSGMDEGGIYQAAARMVDVRRLANVRVASQAWTCAAMKSISPLCSTISNFRGRHQAQEKF